MVEGLLMRTVGSVLLRFQHEQSPPKVGTNNPFRLASTLSKPAKAGEVADAWEGIVLPAEIAEMWSAVGGARLFEDIDYGQWGLVILDPIASAARTAHERAIRPSEFASDDIVLGEFLGDQELLVVAPSEEGARRIMIALPLDARSDWFGVAGSLGEFLEAYLLSAGDKFWERTRPL
jgi:hypothetical protein